MDLDWLISITDKIKSQGKFDALKTQTVLGLESFDFSMFHLISLLLFVCAILHTLSINSINSLARRLELRKKVPKWERKRLRGLGVQTLYFLGEVEVVFAFWAIPLFIAIACAFGWNAAVDYINTRDYTECLFVVVIMCLAYTRPIILLAENTLRMIARWLGGSLSAWWYTLLTLGPLLGSLITEIGAMALCSVLLSRQFYEHAPSRSLSYATLGLLFVNISIGGVLTTFASPAVLVLSHSWHWTTFTMMYNFGWKAVIGIVLSNALYWLYFRKEFTALQKKRELLSRIYTPRPDEPLAPPPFWITITHVCAIVWVVFTSHYPAIFIGGFLFFLGFHQATRIHQYPIRLMRPILIGLFLAGLVIHGGVQGWWVVKLLGSLSPLGVLGVSILLTGFNDNAAIAYLATLVPSWELPFKYALFSGIVAGGGLTVIANAPNPAGYVILKRHFENGISPFRLFLAAALPTFILYVLYFVTAPFLW